MISYQDLLEVFWKSHKGTDRAWSRQYMPVLFYENARQQEIAEASKAELEAEYGRPVVTPLLPLEKFYLAEEYHQKYRMQNLSGIMQDFKMIYPKGLDWVHSPAAAKINAFAGRNATVDSFNAISDQLGLSNASIRRLQEILQRKW